MRYEGNLSAIQTDSESNLSAIQTELEFDSD